jgi:hypothetical protein
MVADNGVGAREDAFLKEGVWNAEFVERYWQVEIENCLQNGFGT